MLHNQSEGHLELSKEQGSAELKTDFGAQKDSYIRSRFIGTVRARTQMLINQSMLHNFLLPTVSQWDKK